MFTMGHRFDTKTMQCIMHWKFNPVVDCTHTVQIVRLWSISVSNALWMFGIFFSFHILTNWHPTCICRLWIFSLDSRNTFPTLLVFISVFGLFAVRVSKFHLMPCHFKLTPSMHRNWWRKVPMEKMLPMKSREHYTLHTQRVLKYNINIMNRSCTWIRLRKSWMGNGQLAIAQTHQIIIMFKWNEMKKMNEKSVYA